MTRPLFLLALLAFPGSLPAQEATLLLTGARVWTGDSARPWAEAVALAGDRILAVGTAADLARLRGARTRVLELRGRFVSPGFIDNHTHFGQAGALLLGANLLDVADDASLVRRVREAAARLPPGAWMVGGDWGAYESWAQNAAGPAAQPAARPVFTPTRDLIDSLTPNRGALLSKWDRSVFLANSRALEAAGATCAWEGVDCTGGRPTGRLSPAAADRVRAAMPPKAMAQRIAEAQVALAQLREYGVTTIHDNTSPEQLEVYQALRRQGELTVRVYARPTMDRVEALRAQGIGPGFGDEWIKLGGLKGFVTASWATPAPGSTSRTAPAGSWAAGAP